MNRKKRKNEMKRLLLFCMVCIALSMQAQKKDIVISREQGAITFVVDENLPAPSEKRKLYPRTWDGIAQAKAKECNIIKTEEGLVAASFEGERFASLGSDELFRILVKCFAEHRPLTLSPDMVWLIIAQGFSHYANEHAEELRPLLVNHEGRKILTVKSKHDLFSMKADWETVIGDFKEQIAGQSKGQIAEVMEANFTTTDVTTRIASQVTLMDVMKPYFEFVVHYVSCGIPQITLLGTPEDWQKVQDKTEALRQYGLEWWADALRPILTEFIHTAEGKPNQDFWKNIVMQVHPERLRGGGCDFSKPDELDGWFLQLFPFCLEGRTPATVPHTTTSMLKELVEVPFRYVITDKHGNLQSETPMMLYAGFVGVEEDSTTMGLTPKIGWIVRKAESDEVLLERLKAMAESQDYFKKLELNIAEVPEILSQLKHIERLELNFLDHINLPEWMDGMEIKSFRVSGRLTHEEEKALRQRFPKITISGTYLDNDGSVPPPPIIVLNNVIQTQLDANTALMLYGLATDDPDYCTQELKIKLGLKEVKEVTILKDKSATAIWGIKGAGGVLEVKGK